MTYLYNRKEYTERRKSLRNNMTLAEKILWYHLKSKNLDGIKFRRQYGVDHFTLDFYAPMARLAIEIDGDSHFEIEAKRHDQFRNHFLNTKQIRCIRFLNTDVYENLEQVLESIRSAIQETPPNLPL